MRGSSKNRLVIAVPYKIVSKVSPIQPAPSRGSAKPSVTNTADEICQAMMDYQSGKF